METTDIELFSEICLDSDSEYYSDSESDVYFKQPATTRYHHYPPKQIQTRLQPVVFENYVQNNCQHKIKILNRSTFQQISRPIVICFNHFREKCAYHLKYLDIFYELSLKYGDRIEFIAADMLDLDVINHKWHSMDLFCTYVSPENESATFYAIDQQKRIHQIYSFNNTLQCLMDLCENLLKGRLFISQPLPEPNHSSLVKICVHQNYAQLVTNATRHVLLIVNCEDYCDINREYEPNYESVAEQLQAYHVDVVHINGQKNYIPFELGIFCYPTLLLIPKDDKGRFVDFLKGPRNEENIVNGIKCYLDDPKRFLEKQQQLQLEKKPYRPLEVNCDFNMDFKDLQQYLQVNCQNRLKVYERQNLLKIKHFIIMAFMDFSNEKCSAPQFKWLDKIYQVAAKLSTPIEYFIADFKDIDVINPSWNAQDFIRATAPPIAVFGVDLQKNKFVMQEFRTAASLFYFAYSLSRGDLYYSEPWPNIYQDKLVKTCIAQSLNLCISSIKKHIFLVIYRSNTETNEKFLSHLEEIALEVVKFSLKIIKIDACLNYIPLEMDDTIYPILYFIPQTNKSQRIRFTGDIFAKDDIVNFIIKNVQNAGGKSSK